MYIDGLYDVTFSTGNTAILTITLIDDNTLEENEVFHLMIFPLLPDGVIFGDHSFCEVKIIDNDSKSIICAYVHTCMCVCMH